MAEVGEVIIKIKVDASLWDVIKLRIAGANKIKKLAEELYKIQKNDPVVKVEN